MLLQKFHTPDSQVTKLLKYILVDMDDPRRLRVAVKSLHIAVVRGEQQARARYDTVISNLAPKDVPTLLDAQIVGAADSDTDYHVRNYTPLTTHLETKTKHLTIFLNF